MIELVDVRKIYNRKKTNEFEALHNVSLSIEDGEMVAIIGTSGAGKSTLLHIIACIDSYEGGIYTLNGKKIRKMSEKTMARVRNEEIGIVMQDFALIDNYTVFENVCVPLDFSNKRVKNKRRKVLEALDRVGIESLKTKKVNQLSGGQKQRVAIARAIVKDANIIIADEPTGALDSKNSKQVIELFKSLNEEGKTIIIVTHDMTIASECSRIVEIKDGTIYESEEMR